MSEQDPYETLRPERYYDAYGRKEWERLEATLGGRLEFDGTVDALETWLPPSGPVLDVGGGAGRYTLWLADRGYEVTLVDLSERQCELAREGAQDRDLQDLVTVQRGDVRDLPFDEDRFEAVLCTGGPLSHVVDDDERHGAMTELARVAAPDAPVFASVMSLLAVLQNLVTADTYRPTLPEFLADGSYTRAFAREHLEEPEFVECQFFRAEEFRTELEAAGLTVEELRGLEAIAANVGERIDADDVSAEGYEAVRETVAALRSDPAVVDWSNHILAVARA